MKKNRRPGDRSISEKLKAVIEFEGLDVEKQGEYLRREGLQSEHIAAWKQSMEAAHRGFIGTVAVTNIFSYYPGLFMRMTCQSNQCWITGYTIFNFYGITQCKNIFIAGH